MAVTLLAAAVVFLAIALTVVIVYTRGRRIEPKLDTSELTAIFTGGSDRIDRLIREEMARSRDEARIGASELRQEVGGAIVQLGNVLRDEVAQMRDQQKAQLEQIAERVTRLEELTERRLTDFVTRIDEQHETLQRDLVSKHDQIRTEAAENRQKQRDEIGLALKNFNDSLLNRLDSFSAATGENLTRLTNSTEQQLVRVRATFDERMGQLGTDLTSRHDQLRDEANRNRAQHREEIATRLKESHETLIRTLTEIQGSQNEQIQAFREQLDRMTRSGEERFESIRRAIQERLESMQQGNAQQLDAIRLTIDGRSKESHETLIRTLTEIQGRQNEQIEAFRTELERLTGSTAERIEAIRKTLQERLEAIQQNNTQQLESIRLTVDEKLNETLEKRLGESFRQVSDRLEQVHKGLGEMQTLANGVGDLKKVLANVKMRGGWGEVQLEALLEQMLAPDQFERNVRTKESSRESVEFAVKFPGRDGDAPLYLPLDAKFPLEDYQRLVDAFEAGDAELVESFGKDLERRIKACGKDIRDKYINPPMTTDFAIMFLPVEGLYAEVLRRPGLADELQREMHVMVAGPTTLAAILSSLQMGFRTLAIEKRSSEVWKLLAAVKTEFGKFGGVLATVKRNLDNAANNIDKVAVRSRAMERKLRDVESLPEPDAAVLLQISASGVLTADITTEDSEFPTVPEEEEDLISVT
jgi:DNA recombination protein RmuC